MDSQLLIPLHRRRRAMTLIEIIGLLAVLSIFAAVLLRAVLREMDHKFVLEERAALTGIAKALQRSITQSGTIPNLNDWAVAVSKELGTDTNNVLRNPRGHPRTLLFDSGGLFGKVSLPYTPAITPLSVTAADVTNDLARARIIVVSTPTALPVLQASDFDALWTSAPGAAPPSSGAFSTWSGRREDFNMERLDLSDSFVGLSIFPGVPSGIYRIGDNPESSSVFGGYVLKGTVLDLCHSAGVAYVDSRVVLARHERFEYEEGRWRAASFAVESLGMDLAGVAYAFLIAPINVRAEPGQQQRVVETMIQFMEVYTAWAAAGAPETYRTDVMLPLQSKLLTDVRGLFLKEGSIDRYPYNPATCQ